MTTQTELVLANWRFGNTSAERLFAAVLSLDGFVSIKPQAPIGGPDSKADILCSKGGYDYVAACYFPATDKNYNQISVKFKHDLEGRGKKKIESLSIFYKQKTDYRSKKEAN